MRIKAFSHLIENYATPYELKNCNVVIDAQNFFYDFYKESGLLFEFGAECDQYSKYLRKRLSMFTKANIKCYFIFKGGTKALVKKITKYLKHLDGGTNFIDPIFAIDVHLEVLKQMELDYYFSEYESKSDCMTLARKISCPVISSDIEFPLSGVQYIPKKSLGYFNVDHITCKLFSLDIFLQKLRLDMDKLAIFILLTDENIFPGHLFYNLFRLRRIPTRPFTRNTTLLNWLSESLEEDILHDILNNTEIEEQVLLEKLNEVKNMVRGEVKSEVAFDYFFNKRNITDWFVTGVATNIVAREYVDLYRSNILFKPIYDDDDFMAPSLNIIKYGYDLLTAFKSDGFKLICYYFHFKPYKCVDIREAIKKPSVQSDHTIFQNGWEEIRSCGLFQHFLSETISFDCDKLQNTPDDAKMLMITLVYIVRMTKLQPNGLMFTSEMAYGVLLSYVMLGVVQERVNGVQKDNLVTKSDCSSALDILHKYFNVQKPNQRPDKTLLTPLKQFQLALLEMNNLNKLCGSPFVPTSYGKTYNGTFVYEIIFNMKNKGIISSVNRILYSAPSVLKYFNDIIELYKKIIESD